MQEDIRDTVIFREVESLHKEVRQPGTGQISDAAEVHAAPDGRNAVFAGVMMEALEGAPLSRICRVDLASGDIRVLTFGPNTDRLPKYSPASRHVAFLSDRQKEGDFQLYLLDTVTGVARSTPSVEGWVEYLHWSPDGKRILLGVAGHGADISGGQGAITSKPIAGDVPSWIPKVQAGDESHRWRRAWVYELDADRVRPVSSADINIWEAVWCGNDTLAAIVSLGAGEGLWYYARLSLIGIEARNSREIYVPRTQLGWPAASPSGERLAVVEATCSDRWIVAGDLWLIDTASGNMRKVDSRGVDVTYTEWRSERHLLLAGHRDFETVISIYDTMSNTLTEVWCTADVTTGGRYITVSGLNEPGDCVMVGESFVRAPEIAVILSGTYRSVKSFDLGYSHHARVIEAVDRTRWKAPDGLEIQGWLLSPQGRGPHPLIMNIHGGPVWHWRPTWLGRWGVHLLILVARGYAIFLPNPRGSGGRGQAFAQHVLGDIGGADAQDLVSGLNYLIEQGIAHPRWLGVTGTSYGGFMTSWLITQDSRFAAAVPVAPYTNQVTEHLISNIPHFVKLFLADTYTNANGRYFERSPIMHAQKAKTPTLNICGALDRCTPPEEAVQFHNALLENGVKSVLVTYPEEGHGVSKFPAQIDYAARIVSWFEEHMACGIRLADDQGCNSG